MLRLCIALPGMLVAMAPVAAETDAEVHDGLTDDLGNAICGSALGVDARTVELSARLRVVSDAARLDAMVAGKQLAVDLALAAARLNNAAAANVGRNLYIRDVHQAVTRYQHALSEAQARWTQDSAQVYNENQVDVAHLIQTTQVDVANALQHAQEAMVRGPQATATAGCVPTGPAAGAAAAVGAGARPRLELGGERGERMRVPAPVCPTQRRKPRPPAHPPTPTGPGIQPIWRDISCDEQSLASVVNLEATIAQARERYMADVTELESACDGALAQAAHLASPDEMAATMCEAARELEMLAKDRHDRYAMEVRRAIRAAELPAVRAVD